MNDYRISIRDEIVSIFRTKVKGKFEPILTEAHDGAAGHWLEHQFGIQPNNNGAADYKGYELKKDTSSKTTFGDWSADRYLFSGENQQCTRDEFIRIFGSPNPGKGGRYSWSGSCVPKVNKFNDFGQLLHVGENGDIFAVYNFDQDKRNEKTDLIPSNFQRGNIALAIWSAETLQLRVEQKFGVYGWFSVRKGPDKSYQSLVFGQPIDFTFWIGEVKKGAIYLDSGMIEGANKRPYSSWRASNTLWESLIVDSFS